MNESITKRTLLIIDDDQLMCDTIIQGLDLPGLNIMKAHKGNKGVDLCAECQVDVVLLDQKLPDGDGVDLCSQILSYNDQCKIIFITAYPSFENAVEAIKAGAHDYVSKPFELEEIKLSVQKAVRAIDLERVAHFQQYNTDLEKKGNVLVGAGGSLNNVWQLINLAAENRAPVLITGETGVGKGVVAKLIHAKSCDVSSSFISVNCAALPDNLIESELFGYEKGAFTGAEGAKKGLFELAEGGSLFLDELGELPIHLQSKLLGVLDDRKLRRIGGRQTRHVNTRVIAATNVDLDNSIKTGKFRNDLYYRLSVILIHIPPLQSRIADIPQLCGHFIHKIAPDHDISLANDEMEKLKQYDWPGNVRELRNIIERSIIIRKSPEIFPSKLLNTNHSAAEYNTLPPLGESNDLIALRELEERHIKFTLNRLNQNHTQAARSLGISRSTLLRKMKSFESPNPSETNTASK
ncbi:MAG: sigma-54-dependent Fis family transcriptional regulator [Desulfobacteraceae bacterium]|nr:sigma-54-dependent Fis family transcriptional regulator [Desulfobacteraceae bacterium]